MVSILLGVWNGGGVCCCCAAQCSGAARALLTPLQCWRLLLSCRALFLAGVWCVGGGCVSVLFVWWGILCPLPPSQWWRVGPSWMVGWYSGWWVAWRKKGGCAAGLPVECWRPPSVCWRPPSVCSVVPLNGGSGVLLCCPPVSCCPCLLRSVLRLRIGSGTRIVQSPLVLHSLVSCCPLPLRVAVLLCCVWRTGGWCVL